MLTSNFGEYLTQNMTQYYSGWVYSPGCDYGKFCYDIFTRWLGNPKDPKRAEDDVTTFEAAYRYAATRGVSRAKYHPRLMDQMGITSNHLAPDAVEGALK